MSVHPTHAFERFRVLRPLRRTARGTTYLARDDRSTCPTLLRRIGYAAPELERQIKNLNRIGHGRTNRLARWLCAGNDQGALWTAQELPWGYPLDYCVRHLWTKSGGMSVPMALNVTFELLRALVKLHGGGHLHGDIAPEHVYVLRTGSVTLTGAGEWPLLTAASLSGFRLSAEHLAYRSKERLYVTESSPEDDVFAVACLLYYMIAGRQDLQGDSLVETCQRVNAMDFLRLDARRKDVSEELASTLDAVLRGGAILSATRLIQILEDAWRSRSGDEPFVSQDLDRLFDGSVQSTLGVTSVDALHGLWSESLNALWSAS